MIVGRSLVYLGIAGLHDDNTQFGVVLIAGGISYIGLGILFLCINDTLLSTGWNAFGIRASVPALSSCIGWVSSPMSSGGWLLSPKIRRPRQPEATALNRMWTAGQARLVGCFLTRSSNCGTESVDMADNSGRPRR